MNSAVLKSEQYRELVGSRPEGRPPGSKLCTPAVEEALLNWLYEGGSIAAFCRQPGMPSRRRIDDWKEEDPEFARRLARAREASADVLVELGQDIADEGARDLFGADVQWAKLRIEQLNKRAACYDPKRYGQKQQTDVNVNITLDALITGSFEEQQKQLPAPNRPRITVSE